jgi:hypothetical protein
MISTLLIDPIFAVWTEGPVLGRQLSFISDHPAFASENFGFKVKQDGIFFTRDTEAGSS